MKKLVSIVLALALVLASCAVAFAAGTRTITVDKNYKDQTYTLYKIFNATVNAEREAATDADNASSVTTDGIAYTLIDTTNHALTKEFSVTKADGTTATVKGADWFEFVNATNNNIKLKSGADITTELFRLWAKAYGVQTGSALTASKDNDTSIKWTGLDDGYYFISTTTGSLVTVDSVAPNAIVKDKNEVPTIDKTVTGGTEVGSATAAVNQEANTASIGDELIYTATVHAKANAKNYKLVDTMERGLSLLAYSDSANLLVQVGGSDLTLGTDYTIDTFTTGKAGTFTISFTQPYLDSLTANTDIVVTYKVQVNEEAEIASANVNEVTLKYGDNQTETHDETETFAYKFQIVKDNTSKKILEGAEFLLYDAETDGNLIPVVKVSDGQYRLALATETGVAIEAGTPVISGLENGTYWVEETKAPDGYNKLEGRVSITIEDADDTATIENETYVEGGLEVINQQGTVLPSTGGIGTTIFYILGGLLVVGAAVILVARRKAQD